MRFISILVVSTFIASLFYLSAADSRNRMEKELHEITSERDELLTYKTERELLKKENEELRQRLLPFEKRAYLTFDDGPSSNTLLILDILKTENIKATFFVNGRPSEEDLAILKRTASEGHAIGNHTYSHDYRTIYRDTASFLRDFTQLETLLKEEVGVSTPLYRFPGGSLSNQHVSNEVHAALSDKGYVFFDWNIDSKDTSSINPEKDYIVQSTLEQISGKKDALILFHDTLAKTNTVLALPEIIRELKTQGYRFDVLSLDSYNRQFVLER